MDKKQISVIEVGPRDGFQSVKGDFIPTELKKEIIDLLVEGWCKAYGIYFLCQSQGNPSAG